MNLNLLERRLECLSFHSRGLRASEWAELVAKKYNSTRQAVLKDWVRRKEWMPQVFQLTDVDKIIYDACNTLEQIRAAGWQTYYASANQPAVQVGALKQIADVTAKQVEMLQSVGKIEKAAEKLNTVNTVKVEMAGLGKRPTVKA